ncbi:VOC family protein [Pseudomonas aeruginosa]|nr:VOC family protein [Pseudomonas aeruginosa]
MERAIPTFPCRDLDSASAFYQSLGFHLGARYPTYAILQRGALELHLSLFEALEPKTNCSAAYLRLEDAQALHRQATALGLGGQDSTHHGPGRPTLGHARICLIDPDGNLLRVGQELDATPEQHRVRLASADDVPAVAALWQANVREAGETLDAGDQQAIQALLLAASRNRLLWLAEAQQHPAVSSSPTCGRSRTVRHGSERSQSSTYYRRPAARAWPGNWWAAPRRPCARAAPA